MVQNCSYDSYWSVDWLVLPEILLITREDWKSWMEYCTEVIIETAFACGILAGAKYYKHVIQRMPYALFNDFPMQYIWTLIFRSSLIIQLFTGLPPKNTHGNNKIHKKFQLDRLSMDCEIIQYRCVKYNLRVEISHNAKCSFYPYEIEFDVIA